jgi:hypothetical protein
MGSLRTFHILFIMIVFVAMDLFGAWAVWRYDQTGGGGVLFAGILAFAIGFGLVGYILWMLHKFDRAKIE